MKAPRAWSISPTRTEEPIDDVPSSGRTVPSSRPRSVVLPDPLGPVMASRSPRSTCTVTGPSVKSLRRTTAPRGRGHHLARRRRSGDGEPQLPLLAGLVDLVQPLDHLLGAPGLAGQLLAGGDVVVADELVLLGLVRPGGARALVGPGPLRPRPFGERADGVGVLLVPLAGVGPGPLPFLQVGVVAAAVQVGLLLVQVELQHLVDGAGQELPVVADHDDADVGAGARTVRGCPGRPGQDRWSVRPAAGRRTG